MSLFNLSPARRQLSTATITVNRPSVSGFNTDGTSASTSNTAFTGVRTSFQYLGNAELQHMPEGDRDKTWVKVWPAMQLQTGDRIVHPSKGTFIVQKLDECMDEGGFTAAFARKLGDGES